MSVKVNHKTLLLFGALCIVIGTVGCLLAPSLLFLQIFYPFDGIGTIIVASMCFTIIGETLPLERRAKTIGVVTSTGIISLAIGFALAGFFANNGGYRSYLALYVLPIALIAVLFAYFIIPKALPQVTGARQSFISSFKEVLAKKSALACLIGNTFLSAGGMWSFFAATFWLKKFSIPIEIVALITVAVVSVYALGGLLGGRLIDRAGRKRFVVISWLTRGVLIISIVFMPDVWSALVMSFIATLIGGFSVTGGHALLLEQAPNSRGTMMSVGGVFGSVGVSVGVAVGGLALIAGFESLGLTLGLLTIVASMVILILAKEPCKSIQE